MPVVPLVVCETAVDNDTGNYLIEKTDDYAHLVDVCHNKNIPYAGWCFDEACPPNMLSNCGEGTDLYAHTPWGNLYLNGISCNNVYCT